jgi:hypothetical protein
MLRDLIHIDSLKNVAQEAVNCWLTYAMSQPVNFNLAIIALFILQYTGVDYVKNLVDRVKVEVVRYRLRK